MYDVLQIFTTPGCRQCTPVDVNNNNVSEQTNNYGQLISVYAIRVIARNALLIVFVFPY